MIDIDLTDIPRDKVIKLLESWEGLYENCLRVYRKKPNEYLDGFMSSLDIRMSDLERLLDEREETE